MAYSLISNAIKASEVKNGDSRYWQYSNNVISTEEFFNIYFRPYLNILKDCKHANKGCFSTCETSLGNMDGWSSVGGKNQFAGGWTPNLYYKVILTNGMGLAVTNVNVGNCAAIVVDLDGPKKGKGIMGEDVFYFKLCGDSPGAWSETGFNPGSECRQGVRNTHKNSSLDTLLTDTACYGGCNINATSANGRIPGEACSAVIIKNNYTIPGNYPIKF